MDEAEHSADGTGWAEQDPALSQAFFFPGYEDDDVAVAFS